MSIRLDRQSCLLAAMLIAGTALLYALFIQWLGYEPCVLCLRQRVPYYIGIPALALAYAMEKFDRVRVRVRNWLTCLGLLSFGAVVVLAANHVGVEHGLWEGPATCVARTLDTSSLEAFTAQIGGFAMVSCNIPSFTILGLSLASWNLGVALSVCGFLAVAISSASKRH